MSFSSDDQYAEKYTAPRKMQNDQNDYYRGNHSNARRRDRPPPKHHPNPPNHPNHPNRMNNSNPPHNAEHRKRNFFGQKSAQGDRNFEGENRRRNDEKSPFRRNFQKNQSTRFGGRFEGSRRREKEEFSEEELTWRKRPGRGAMREESEERGKRASFAGRELSPERGKGVEKEDFYLLIEDEQERFRKAYAKLLEKHHRKMEKIHEMAFKISYSRPPPARSPPRHNRQLPHQSLRNWSPQNYPNRPQTHPNRPPARRNGPNTETLSKSLRYPSKVEPRHNKPPRAAKLRLNVNATEYVPRGARSGGAAPNWAQKAPTRAPRRNGQRPAESASPKEPAEQGGWDNSAAENGEEAKFTPSEEYVSFDYEGDVNFSDEEKKKERKEIREGIRESLERSLGVRGGAAEN